MPTNAIRSMINFYHLLRNETTELYLPILTFIQLKHYVFNIFSLYLHACVE